MIIPSSDCFTFCTTCFALTFDCRLYVATETGFASSSCYIFPRAWCEGWSNICYENCVCTEPNCSTSSYLKNFIAVLDVWWLTLKTIRQAVGCPAAKITYLFPSFEFCIEQSESLEKIEIIWLRAARASPCLTLQTHHLAAMAIVHVLMCVSLHYWSPIVSCNKLYCLLCLPMTWIILNRMEEKLKIFMVAEHVYHTSCSA